jgi:hypothetical protein
MLLFIASIYNSIKQSPSPILQDIDTFHVAKICQALLVLPRLDPVRLWLASLGFPKGAA